MSEKMLECPSCTGNCICDECGGDGFDENEHNECEVCQGSGECPECEGSGEVPAPVRKESP